MRGPSLLLLCLVTVAAGQNNCTSSEECRDIGHSRLDCVTVDGTPLNATDHLCNFGDVISINCSVDGDAVPCCEVGAHQSPFPRTRRAGPNLQHAEFILGCSLSQMHWCDLLVECSWQTLCSSRFTLLGWLWAGRWVQLWWQCVPLS